MTSQELAIHARTFRTSLKIADKRRNTVPFELNDHQLTYFANQTYRDILAKSRQLGFSTGILGDFFTDCLTLPNTNAVVISHDAPTTEKLFQKIHFFIKHYPVHINLSHASKHEITFPDTDSTFYIGTAGARVFGRGDTINRLHCSEYAFWENPEQIMRGLLQAVPHDGRIVIESTSNGVGNSYCRRCMKALSGTSSWRLHVYPWFLSSEYSLAAPASFIPTEEEISYVVRVFDATGILLTYNQLWWRRFKLDELEEDRQLGISPEQFFDQEYPYDLLSSFLTSGSGVFSKLSLTTTPASSASYRDGPLWVFEEPIANTDYVLGVDVAEGLFLDRSVIQVLKLTEGSPVQVAEWASDMTAPDKLANVIADLGTKYNNALVVVERNNHGLTTLTCLKYMYSPSMLYRQRHWGTRRYTEPDGELLGHRTTASTKPKMIDDLYVELRNGLTYHSPLLHSEMETYTETRTDHGNIVLGASGGNKDDRVMALALAVQGAKVYYRSYKEPEAPALPVNCLSLARARLQKETRAHGHPGYIKRTRERLHASRQTLLDSYYVGAL
jgi:hypothetical protein